MATKRKLSDLVRLEVESASDTQTSKLTESGSSEVLESVSDKVPRYLLLDRKEARLRADQIERLNGLTKLLNRRRRGQGERITDNTLIRVAVDLLLHRANEVRGATEVEIQSNLKLNL